MIFQDPMTSLNPTIKIGKQIAEAVLIHNKNYTKEQVHQKVLELMELVGISHPKERYHQYPWAVLRRNAPEMRYGDCSGSRSGYFIRG